ncbi:MAG: hypothetical protein ACI9SP_004025 [Arenicella sp.]|jgi:hypothetical protein
MNYKIQNPFEITKAVDFTDKQITDYWVDNAGEKFRDSLKPASTMPMIILGGKGTGKTHLMRYFSYASQKIRHDEILEGICADGYIGIYLRCGGLNANRFNELGDSKGDAAFSYFMDLWLSEICIRTVMDIFETAAKDIPFEKEVAGEICRLFNDTNVESCLTLEESLEIVLKKQRTIDLAVNNYPFTEEINIDIETSPGKLVFSIPQILCNHIPELKDVIFSFFIDEFENLDKNHQKYVNTLVREKELPCSFKIGSRLYGIKTLETYSANEVNRVGSEFDYLTLGMLETSSKQKYRKFCRTLFTRRLKEAGFIQVNVEPVKDIDNFFELFENDDFFSKPLEFIQTKYSSDNRPASLKLIKKLTEFGSTKENISEIITNLSVANNPLLEKLNYFLFYQDWYQNKDLKISAITIGESSAQFEETRDATRHKQALNHFKGDLYAQLLKECDRKQQYYGIDTFIDMSAGIPRNFLMILKHVFQWSSYRNENPFRWPVKISMESQRQGVNEAAEWFYRDARISGNDVESVRDSISELARLFRSVRFSDKPTECSISTFSVNASQLTRESRDAINLATFLSLLIEIKGGQRDRNSGGVDAKYQINPMLAPRWDLPISRRGTIALNKDEVNSIFDSEYRKNFEGFLKIRLGRMTAPYFGRGKKNGASQQAMGFIE